MEDRQEILKHEVGNQSTKIHKTPRRIIYFASGESMEEYSTEEEEEVEVNDSHQPLDAASLSWGTYLRFWALRVAAVSFFTCEFLGGKIVTLFGLNEPKYQYAIDEYYRTQKEDSDSDEDGKEMESTDPPKEKEHLEMQSIGYGSIHCQNTPALPQENSVVNVDEVEENRLQKLKCTPATGK